ncbi:HlyD family secretion protein [Variovorax sp. HJSM1_2]|uniref:HlyD family secretion protein n=1 Tax=Variovorax sp. HJSM1_2 TaxID=3366263 RepID=UPI003BD6518E
MELLLLGIYAFFVWLLCVKLKWIPWNIVTQVIAVIIPVVALTVLILTLNVIAPASADVRVIKYTIPIVSQVRGRVIEVPIEEGNRPVKKGDVLFRVDPKPYQLEVNTLTAQLANAQAGQRETEESLKAARGKVSETQALGAQASGRLRDVSASLELARKRVAQYRELVQTGAGSKFDLEKAETDLRSQEAKYDEAKAQQSQASASEVQAVASVQQVQQKLGAKVDGEYAQVAQIRAQLENAKWLLEQTVTRSPCDCTVVNLQLRAGGFVAGFPINPVVTLVEDSGQMVALFDQNELHKVASGNEIELALETIPGKVIKGKVDSIIWTQGQGQLQANGSIPNTGALPQVPGRYAVKFHISDRDKELFIAGGAAGHAAIYTDHLHEIQILRKVFIRLQSYLFYLVLKL